MIRLILSFLVALVWPFGAFNSISQNNLARKEADTAFRNGNYQQAARYYAALAGKSADATVWLDLGHAYFALGDFRRANSAYQRFEAAGTGPLLAVTYVQRSIIACTARDTSGALALLQRALLIDPLNEPARYNFELLKSRFSGRQKQQKQAKRTDKPKVESRPDSVSQEVVRSSRQDQVLQRLRNLNMTEEQANQLLNAMRDDDLPLELARRRNARSSRKNRW